MPDDYIMFDGGVVSQKEPKTSFLARRYWKIDLISKQQQAVAVTVYGQSEIECIERAILIAAALNNDIANHNQTAN